jgi:hypothetical protein
MAVDLQSEAIGTVATLGPDTIISSVFMQFVRYGTVRDFQVWYSKINACISCIFHV